eukprot:PhM_4_TR4262/c0_g1_i1/m.13543
MSPTPTTSFTHTVSATVSLSQSPLTQTWTAPLTRTMYITISFSRSFLTPSKTGLPTATALLTSTPTAATYSGSEDPSTSYSPTITLTTKGIQLPPIPTASATATAMLTLTLAVTVSRTPGERDLVTATHNGAGSATPTRHVVTETDVASVTSTANPVSATVTPTPSVAAAPVARRTLPPVVEVVPVPTLSPEAFTSTAPTPASPSSASSGGGVASTMNAFMLGSASGFNFVWYALAFMTLLVATVSYAMYRACRNRPTTLTMSVEPIQPRTSWPQKYKYSDVLRALFPDAASPPIPDYVNVADDNVGTTENSDVPALPC